MSTITFTVKSEESQAVLQDRHQRSGSDSEMAIAAMHLFSDLSSGSRRASVDIQTGSADPVAASGTLTLVSAIATDAITVGSETFTFTSTPSTENDVEVDGATDADDASALAAAINAHSVASQIVTASALSNVVTITAKQKGVVGNFINLSSADGTITASGANLTGGTGGVTEAGVTASLGL